MVPGPAGWGCSLPSGVPVGASVVGDGVIVADSVAASGGEGTAVGASDVVSTGPGSSVMAGGAAVGLVYPWLGAAVLREAPAGEQDLAASSLMTVQLCATAFGVATAGLVMNLAAGTAGDAPDLAPAARWIFALAAIAPLASLPLHGRLRL